MTIYERIKYLRQKQGLSQQDLADKLGYKSRSTINKIELGLRDISQKKVIAFANALGVTPAYLLGWEPDELDKKVLDLYPDWIPYEGSYLPTKDQNTIIKPTENDRLNEFIELCSQLSDDDLDIVETLIDSLIKKHDKDD